MESPAYQYDDFKKIQKRNSVAKNAPPPQIKSAMGSLNENSVEKIGSAAGNLLKGSKDKSKTESINDDKEDLDDILYDYENNSIVERVIDDEERLLNAENFNKVSPYSIRNLSGYPIKVLKKYKGSAQQEDNSDSFNVYDSFF
jgi:hypothetical protein